MLSVGLCSDLKMILPDKNRNPTEKQETNKNEQSHIMNTSTQEYTFKYIIIGDSGVGKSSLMSQFTDGKCTVQTFFSLMF